MVLNGYIVAGVGGALLLLNGVLSCCFDTKTAVFELFAIVLFLSVYAYRTYKKGKTIL